MIDTIDFYYQVSKTDKGSEARTCRRVTYQPYSPLEMPESWAAYAVILALSVAVLAQIVFLRGQALEARSHQRQRAVRLIGMILCFLTFFINYRAAKATRKDRKD